MNCRTSRDLDRAAGDGDIALLCSDAIAVLVCTCRIAAVDDELSGAGSFALDGQVAVINVNAVAIFRTRVTAFDGVGRAVRQDDGRVGGQLHRSSGGGGKVHAT